MKNYSHLAADFGRLRRAWKRSAALAGLVALGVDALGILGVLVLVNALFDLHMVGRILLIAAGAVLLLIHFKRGVMAPVTRNIADGQIALYLEERCPEFEGSLLAAAEFGPTADPGTPQGQIVLSILKEAEARLGRVDLRKAIRLDRLRKYGIVCLLLLAVYIVAGAVFPEPVKNTVFKAVNPFYVPPQPEAPVVKGPEALVPITIALTRNDQPLPVELRFTRGGTLQLEAHLNRDPLPGKEEPVFRFRTQAATGADKPAAPAKSADPTPKAATAGEAGRDSGAPVSAADGWQDLPLTAIEELHGYRALLPDINEDLEFYVASGSVQTDHYRIKAIDPLVVNDINLALKYPDYLQMPPASGSRQSADVSAVTGTQATVRFTANNPVASGTLNWADGTVSELKPDPADPKTVTASFPVEKDGSFTYTLQDADAQIYESPVPALVRALPDLPPEISFKQPVIDVAVHPLGEVTIEADLKDDWGVRDAQMVFLTGSDQQGQTIRQQLALEPDPKKMPGKTGKDGKPAKQEAAEHVSIKDNAPKNITSTQLRFKFRLEELKPRLKPGSIITYHIEGSDRKGQTASTDVFFIYVTPYETWVSWNPAEPMAAMGGGATETVIAPLEKFVAAVWHLKQEKGKLSEEEYRKKCEELAKKFETTDPATGEKGMINFLEAGE